MSAMRDDELDARSDATDDAPRVGDDPQAAEILASGRGPQHARAPLDARHRKLSPNELAQARLGWSEDDEDEPVRTRRPSKRRTAAIFLRDVVIVAVLALVVSMAMKTWIVRPYYIPSASMHETLIENDRILVNLFVPELVPLERGDVVVFTDPGGWLPPSMPKDKSPLEAFRDGTLETIGLKPEDANNTLIKRVIGLPGDHVTCCTVYGQVAVNDAPIAEPYAQLAGNTAASGVPFDVTVPANSIWVMGDNRYNSQDSRYHQDLPTGGFVPMESVVGKAFLVNYPFEHFGVLGNYPEVFANVPNLSLIHI